MKKITLLLFMLSFTWLSIAQVGLNTITPDASSALDIESTTGGILIPRLSEFQRDAITLPATGLMIYQTDKNPGFYFYSGAAWTKINGAAGPRGPQGVFGGASFEYQYGGVGPLLSDVDNGLVRFLDTDTQNTATQLQFSELDSNGDSVYSFIEMLSQTQSTTKGVVRLVNKFNSSKNLQFKITNIDFTNATGSSTPGYFIFDVENVASSSLNPFNSLLAASPVVMTYSIAGSDGLQGPQGEQGAQGEQGIQGQIGLTGPAGQDGTNGIDGADGAQGPTGPTGPQGIQGEQGIQGPIGLTGPAGQDGTNGIDGADGAQGPTGPQGIQGEQGIQGPIGLTGLTGPAGQDGTNGVDGADGADGSQGPTGPQGIQGEQGIQGPIGLTGLTGPSGQDGANGINGEDGAVGATGAQGPQGDQGIQGEQGPEGPQGIQGDQGIQGLTGLTGPAGQDGAQGQTGATGPQGIQGPIGVTGPAGQDGTNGIDGVDGQSAYQIWLSRGNTGTEEDFIASLTGPTGANGPQGAQGEQGIQGPIGLTGLTGPAGQDGANGVDGVDGAQGPAGETGPVGATGPIGPQGEQGIQGQDGPSGQDGAVGATGEQGPQGDQGPQGPGGTGGVITREVGKIGYDRVNTPTATAVYYPFSFASFETAYAGTSSPYQIWSYYEAPEVVNNFAFSCNSTGEAFLNFGTQFKLLYYAGTTDYQSEIPTVIWSYTFPTATSINIGETLILPASNLQLPAGRYVWEATFPQYHSYNFILYITTQTSVMGTEGPTGAQGPQGIAGQDGADGAQGPIGPAGETGPAGATGVAGPTGPPGSQGAPGNDGIDGENGMDGEDGLSAYEVWINAGNTGTEQEFLDSLTGPQGGVTIITVGPGLNLTGSGNNADPYLISLPSGGMEDQVLKIVNGVPSWVNPNTSGSIIDQEGNNINYGIYGAQVWTLENADVVTYRDGAPIPQVTDQTIWSNLTTGAWCYYNNDPNNHKLYNWYAVMGIHDSASLSNASLRKEFAPEGWHVPTKDEWFSLRNYLIGNGYNYDGSTGNRIAKSIASKTGWQIADVNDPDDIGDVAKDQDTNNRSGFNMLPHGRRLTGGDSFRFFGSVAVFWSSSLIETNQGSFVPVRFSIGGSGNSLGDGVEVETDGNSVRFIRD